MADNRSSGNRGSESRGSENRGSDRGGSEHRSSDNRSSSGSSSSNRSSATTTKDKAKGRLNPIQVQKYLKGLNYPVQKKDILQRAKANGAEQQMLDQLQNLPEQSYDRPTDVTKAIGKLD